MGGAYLEAVRGLVRSQHQRPGLLQRVNVAIFDQHGPSVQRLCSKRSRTNQSGPHTPVFYSSALIVKYYFTINIFPRRRLHLNHLYVSLADTAADFFFSSLQITQPSSGSPEVKTTTGALIKPRSSGDLITIGSSWAQPFLVYWKQQPLVCVRKTPGNHTHTQQTNGKNTHVCICYSPSSLMLYFLINQLMMSRPGRQTSRRVMGSRCCVQQDS